MSETLYCSFCGKSQHEVKKLIAGPTVFICDECSLLCVDIVNEKKSEADLPSQRRLGGFERAQIRIQAFAALDGWGKKDDAGRTQPWNMDARRGHAEMLAEWALAEDLTVWELPGASDEKTEPVLPPTDSTV